MCVLHWAIQHTQNCIFRNIQCRAIDEHELFFYYERKKAY